MNKKYYLATTITILLLIVFALPVKAQTKQDAWSFFDWLPWAQEDVQSQSDMFGIPVKAENEEKKEVKGWAWFISTLTGQKPDDKFVEDAHNRPVEEVPEKEIPHYSKGKDEKGGVISGWTWIARLFVSDKEKDEIVDPIEFFDQEEEEEYLDSLDIKYPCGKVFGEYYKAKRKWERTRSSVYKTIMKEKKEAYNKNCGDFEEAEEIDRVIEEIDKEDGVDTNDLFQDIPDIDELDDERVNAEPCKVSKRDWANMIGHIPHKRNEFDNGRLVEININRCPEKSAESFRRFIDQGILNFVKASCPNAKVKSVGYIEFGSACSVSLELY